MDFYHHFGFERKYYLDLDSLRKKFYEISRMLHPDLSADSITTEEEINRQIAFHNLAYASLIHPEKRLLHILQLEGWLDLYIVQEDAEFLLEMMELNEEVETAVQTGDSEYLNKLKSQIERRITEDENSIAKDLRNYDEGLRNESIARSMVAYYSRLKYYYRLKQNFLAKEPEL
ncbi:MAG: Fe-S protein assembly co-chaperone HscB [Saprospiraceae bacterium]|nr:Fe-S protein assembly co-chaperone HscB [Saprospiraceae bacterium]